MSELPKLELPNCRARGCAHWIGIRKKGEDEATERPCCAAYPEGIPEEIAYGHDQHMTLRGDETKDLVFEKSDPMENHV